MLFIKYIKKMAPYILVAIFFVSLDRFLKILAINYFHDDKIDIFGNYLSFQFAKNFNIAFSLPFSGNILIFLIMFIIVILMFYSLLLIKNNNFNLAGLITIVYVGAISNLIDRLIFGYVIDYIDVKWFTIFNIADVMIVGGVILILFQILKQEKKQLV